ncbi:MAG: hypothetical protein JXR76_19020 [Deltaproteobacteria bacterium]|nr:hypothetical protein [Deltaproteobacteria bacterium]
MSDMQHPVAYPFLLLCGLLMIPAAVIFVVRSDLRKPMGVMAGLSIPFAFTEFLFYPSYWEPKFLFDLANRIGFGIEDFLFVIGLGAFTSTVYPAVFFKKRVPLSVSTPSLRSVAGKKRLTKLIVPIGVAFLLTAIMAALSIPMIWGCVPIMILIALSIVVIRRDLRSAAAWGGVLSAIAYFLICQALGVLVPNVFELNWHAEKFFGVYILGVPLEEITYAFAAGTVASVVYPFAFNEAFCPFRTKEA